MSFVECHDALIRRRARQYVAETGDKLPAADLAREMELVASQLERAGRLPTDEASPVDLVLRALAQFASGRARRRRKLIEQIAAGDDLQAVSEELLVLDADLPNVEATRSPEAIEARSRLDVVRDRLDPRSRLVFAFYFEDALPKHEFPHVLGAALSEVDAALTLIHRASAECGIEAELDRPEAPSISVTDRREKKLRSLAATAGAHCAPASHLEEPILALIRSGDLSEDLADAVVHLADCADCRAHLEEGDIERRNLVVVAIEAPRGSQKDLLAAAEETGAYLTERGQGRWTAVVEAEKADSFKGTLEKPESSVVTRLAVATPVELPVDASPPNRGGSYPPQSHGGMAASEVSAWAQIARTPRRRMGPSPFWMLLSVLVIGSAVGIAYYLATR